MTAAPTSLPTGLPTSVPASVAKRPRDIRLDVFRGLCLLIIFVAHVWDNAWAAWIPARFGFSDATEIFVFCSGMASAIAFGGSFRTHGMLIGTARVAFRCWQVFWSHIGVTLVAAVLMLQFDSWLGTGGSYIEGLGLGPLVGSAAPQAIVGLLTLRWVPNYFDILPMYLVILVMIPPVMLLSRHGKVPVAVFILATWCMAAAGLLKLPAEPWGTREWFFNPFAWQLVFFTGFAFMSGWLPAPPIARGPVKAALAIVLLTVPFAWAPLTDSFGFLQDARAALSPLTDKTHFGLLRYVHFLSLAYLAYAAAGEGGRNFAGRVAEALRRLGQQSLAVFMAGLVLSFVASTALNLLGRSYWSVPLVNITGIALLLLLARTTAFFKSQPWSKPVKASDRAAERARERTLERVPASPRRESAVGQMGAEAAAHERRGQYAANA